MPLYHFSLSSTPGWLRLPVRFRGAFSGVAFVSSLFSFSVSSAFFAAGTFWIARLFYVPAVSPARSVLCLFLLVSATCLMPPIFPMSAVPPVSKIQPPADCFHFTFLLSHSVYPNSGKSNAFLKFSHVCSTFFSDFTKIRLRHPVVHLFLVSSIDRRFSHAALPGSAAFISPLDRLPPTRTVPRSFVIISVLSIPGSEALIEI